MESLIWERRPYGPPLEDPARGCGCVAVALPVALAPLAVGYVLGLPYAACVVVSVVVTAIGLPAGTRFQRRKDVRRVEVTPAQVRLTSPSATITVAAGDVRTLVVRHRPTDGWTTLAVEYARGGTEITAEVPGGRHAPNLAADLRAVVGTAIEIAEPPGATPP